MTIENKQRLALIAIMVLVAISIAGISLYILYEEHSNDHKTELIHIVKSRARIIEAVARFDKEYSSNYPGGTREATMSQIRDAHENFEGFGETGEFLLGQKKGGMIVFLLAQRHKKPNQPPAAVPMEGKQAEPMRRALRGESGTIIAADYRGAEVLAAYHYVSELNIGLVAKIDVSEVTRPFIKAGIMVSSGGLLVIVFGAWAFFKVSDPLVQSIQKKEKQLDSVLTGAEAYYWDWNLKTDEVIHDPRWAKFLGYAEKEFKSTLQQCINLIHPDDLPKVKKAIEDHIQGRTEVLEVEYRALKKSGEWIWVLDRGKILEWDGDNNPSRAYGTYLSIQKQKETEEKLKEALKRNDLILKSAGEGIYGLDLEGRTTFANPAAVRLLGYSLEEMKDRLQHDLIHHSKPDGSHYERSECPIYAALKDGDIHRVDNEVFWRKDGASFPVEYTSTPIIENNEIVGAVVTFKDITERKNAEKKIAEAQRQLVATQKLAGIGELTAGVSHEVLNPVNIISVSNQMLQRKITDDSYVQNFCNKTAHEIDRIQKIMSSLLEFSRKGGVDLERGHMRDTIEKVLDLIEEEYKLDNIIIVRDWCGKLVDISYDSDKIRQVYLNLLNNSKHSMPNGGTITVGCKQADDNEKFHQFIFSDTGMGMSEEVRLRVFEPFFTTKPEGQGTGMGLSVVHGIIEEHGGKIRVESEEGKGTTITISMPTAEQG